MPATCAWDKDEEPHTSFIERLHSCMDSMRCSTIAKACSCEVASSSFASTLASLALTDPTIATTFKPAKAFVRAACAA
eukprot:scaffold149968_cov33-Tisochrysis_lutea.AAC.2